MELQEQAIAIVKEVKIKWEQCKANYPEHKSIWDNGFDVFYSPVRMNPEFLIVGDNPGGNQTKSNFDPENCVRIPEKHEYLTQNYPLANAMRNVFKKAHLQEQLGNSVKINRIFFRSANLNELEDISVYKELEEFCYSKLKEIIQVIKPKIIFAESLGTLDVILNLLNEIKGNELEKKLVNSKTQLHKGVNYRIYQSYLIEDFFVKGVIGICHLTGQVSWIYEKYPNLKNEEIPQRLAEDYKKILCQPN